MKKRILAMLLVLAMALSLMPPITVAAAEAEGSYQVGYSKVDINPYEDEANNLLSSIPLGGYRYTTTRTSIAEKLDDNGDGVVDENDGIFATCTAVTDKEGNTALFFNCDLLWVFESFQTNVLKTLLTDEAFDDYNLSPDLIYFNGSHNHFAPLVNDTYKKEHYEFAAAYTQWVERVESQLVAGAQAALADRAWADMYKGSVDVSEYFNENNGERKDQMVGDKLNELRTDPSKHVTLSSYAALTNNVEEVFFNCVRQYKITEQKVKTDASGNAVKVDGEYVLEGDPITYVADDGTNGGIKFVGHLHTIYKYDAATGEKTSQVDEVRVIQSVEPVSEVDDKLHLVQFRFADSNKDSVVWLNWRGHLPSTAEVSGTIDDKAINDQKGFFQISSGMVNSLRYTMELAGYRVAFFQGTGGNINMIVKGFQQLAWITNDTYKTEVHNIYGTELAEIALDALDPSDGVMEQVNADGGQIRGTRQNLQTYHSEYTPWQFVAALQFQKANSEAVANTQVGIDGPRVYTTSLWYYEDTAGNPLLDTRNKQLMTDENGNLLTDPDTKATYTNEDGSAITVGNKVIWTAGVDAPVVIPSIFQANTYVDNYSVSGQKGNKLALSVLTIGDGFSVVAAGTELFDRYTENGKNKWDALKEKYNDSGIFVLGYTNSPSGGYMPSEEAYTYSQDSGTDSYAVGIYESTTSPYAAGTGEAVVDRLDIMLDFLKGDHTPVQDGEAYCPHCEETVQWTDLYKERTEGDLQFHPYLRTGHYYIPAGLTEEQLKAMTLQDLETAPGATVCIDLNGQTLYVEQAIEVTGYQSTLNIMDGSAAGTGKVVGSIATQYGGVFHVAQNTTMNLYSGTLSYTGAPFAGKGTASGGIIYVIGTLNMYDGLIEGTTVNHCGGAVHVADEGTANLRGGIIRGGTAKYGTTMTSNGTVVLSGDVEIENLYHMGATPKMNFDGVYTGKIALGGMTVDTLIGTATADADISLARITWWAGSIRCYPEFQKNEETGGFDVYKRVITDYVAKNAETGEFTYGDYVADENTVDENKILSTVLPTLPEGSRITLLEGNVPAEVQWNIDKDLYLELKGKIVYGNITVEEGKTLYVCDVSTADYDITDTNYGRARGYLSGTITGKVVGAPATESSDVYVKVQEGNKLYFHAININIDQLVLRADNKDESGKASPGLYFKHRFDSDDVVKDQVESYGIAFSLTGAPTETDLQAEGTLLYENSVVYRSGNVVYTKMDGASFGKSDAESTSTLITGVMKEENGVSTNARNAQMPIYGVAYVKLTSGAVVFGQVRERTFQQQLEGIDTKWDALTHAQRKGVLKMYKVPTIKSVVDDWDVPNLKDPTKIQADSEKQILRVLSIGNSHTDNATEYLYDVFKAENPNQEVMIAQLYYSGCSVSQHVDFMAKDAAVYRYRTQDNRNPSGYSTMKQALQAEIWDVIILHEMNNSAGAESTYTGANSRNLQKHINNVKKYSLNSDPKLIWNFSWANPSSEYLWGLGYPAGDNYSWVDSYKQNYGSDYDYMLDCMIAQTKKYVMTNSAFADVAPTGLAFKYARDNNPDQTDPDVLLYCDYTHAGEGFGRLLVSYVWYATLTGQTKFTELKYARDLTEDQQELLVEALNHALANKASLKP